MRATKVWPPVVWLSSCMALARMLPGAMEGLVALASDDPDLQDIREDDILGITDDQRAFQRQEQTRVRKAARFFTAAVTRDKLLASSLALRPSLQILGAFFKSARRYETSRRSSILALVRPASSPAYACLRQYITVLRDEGGHFWLPLVGGSGWAAALYHMSATLALMEIGNIYKRLVASMDCWPWRLGLLLYDDLEGDAAKRVAMELLKADDCCLGDFSIDLRRGALSTEDILSPDRLTRLREIYERVPLTNVGAEDRFASAQTRHMAAHGNVGGPETLAADHVLAEAKMVLDSGLARGPQLSVDPKVCVCVRCRQPWDVFPGVRVCPLLVGMVLKQA